MDPGGFLGRRGVGVDATDRPRRTSTAASTAATCGRWGRSSRCFHALGLSPWVVQRLWLGLMLALAAWGMLRLLDVLARPAARGGPPGGGRASRPQPLHGRVHGADERRPCSATRRCRGCCSSSTAACGRRGLARLVVGRGVRADRRLDRRRGERARWWAGCWSARCCCSLYEPLSAAVRWRELARLRLARRRAGDRSASLWWIVPLLVHARYGIDFLQFTEQPRTIWAHEQRHRGAAADGLLDLVPRRRLHGVTLGRSSATSRRRCSSTRSCVGGVAARPGARARGLRLDAALALRAVLPAAGCSSALLIRRPASRRARRSATAMEWVYNALLVVRFMRTTQKAAPLVAIGVAGLLGLGAAAWPGRGCARCAPGRARQAALVGAPVALAALIVLAALPLVRGDAIDGRSPGTGSRPPGREAGDGPRPRACPRTRGRSCCPGQIFAYYDWGGTVDPILPALDRPPGGGPLRDALLRPARGRPALDRGPAGAAAAARARAAAAAAAADGRRRGDHGQRRRHPRSGAMRSGGGRPRARRAGARPPVAHATARARSMPPAARGPRPGRRLPQVRRYDIPAGRGHGARRARGPATIVDGSADGLADMAAFGALPAERRRSSTRATSRRAELRRQAAPRRRGRRHRLQPAPARSCPSTASRTSGPRSPQTSRSARTTRCIDPFPERGSTRPDRLGRCRGPATSPRRARAGCSSSPSTAPIAAFDGDPSTVWVADRYYRPGQPLDRGRVRTPARRALRRPAADPGLARRGDARSTSTASGPSSVRA